MDLGITVAVCSNRISILRDTWTDISDTVLPIDEVLFILDMPDSVELRTLTHVLEEAGHSVIQNQKTRGLSYSRNEALSRAEKDRILFIDDDTFVPASTLAEIRHALSTSEIVGVKVAGPQQKVSWPWYISAGQFHYLSIHAENLPMKTWGACMGFQLPFIRTHDVSFREELGRSGNELRSGDDTTFIAELKEAGASEQFLSHVHVHHNIDLARVSTRYLVRRVFWQGRSEVLRSNIASGCFKEFSRYLYADSLCLKSFGLAFIYGCILVSGVLFQSLLSMKYAFSERELECVNDG